MIWKLLKKCKPYILGADVGRKILATDMLLGATHHHGSVVDFIGEEGTIEALNAKFNAKTVADYWDKVGHRLRITINHLRRGENLDMIKFNSDRSEEIFDRNWHDIADDYAEKTYEKKGLRDEEGRVKRKPPGWSRKYIKKGVLDQWLR